MTNEAKFEKIKTKFIVFVIVAGAMFAAVLSLAQPDRAAARDCEMLHSHEFCLENVP